jgi:hypothetical protein
MRVIDIAGRLQTAGTWEKTAESEADAQALLRHTRAGLRRMLDGNEAFHVDPMATHGMTDDEAAMLRQFDQLASADMVADCTPVAAAPDVWHTEAPPQPGVYLTRWANWPATRRHWDGREWSTSGTAFPGGARQDAWEKERSATEWLRLISADTPAIADWRPGDQVPEGERTGLWHYNNPKYGQAPDPAEFANNLFWDVEGLFLPAAPGVRAGDAYDEARYAKGAA